MLRKAVAELTGLSNVEIKFLRSERGRPYVSGILGSRKYVSTPLVKITKSFLSLNDTYI